jgi:hypothetical protein
MSYYTTWVDFGNPSVASILKKIIFTIVGATNQSFIIKWGTDFTSATGYESTALTSLAASSEYGTAEFGLAEFTGNLATNVVSVNVGGVGKVIQIGFEAQVSNYQISIQKIDIFTKDGKLI